MEKNTNTNKKKKKKKQKMKKDRRKNKHTNKKTKIQKEEKEGNMVAICTTQNEKPTCFRSSASDDCNDMRGLTTRSGWSSDFTAFSVVGSK